MTVKNKTHHFKPQDRLIIGWNEWCELPQLGIPAIKAKIDTGAKTSALHAFDITTHSRSSHKNVCFSIHPIQGNDTISLRCEAPIIDERYIMSSNGHKEHRYVIATSILIGKLTWDIELTLSNRDPLKFRMLLGREALSGRVIIDPNHALCLGRLRKDKLRKIYESSDHCISHFSAH